MTNPKSFCRRCKRTVDFVVEGAQSICPKCGEKFEPAEVAHKIEGGKDGGNGIFKSIMFVLLVWLAIFLVGLAFLFARCAQELKNI